MKWLVYLVVGIAGLLAGVGAGDAFRNARTEKDSTASDIHRFPPPAAVNDSGQAADTSFENLLALSATSAPLISARVLVGKIDSLEAPEIELLISESSAYSRRTPKGEASVRTYGFGLASSP